MTLNSFKEKRKESGSTIRFKTDFHKITSLYSSLKCFLPNSAANEQKHLNRKSNMEHLTVYKVLTTTKHDILNVIKTDKITW
jgi:hypothetical protein